jgi:hypothetical protein
MKTPNALASTVLTTGLIAGMYAAPATAEAPTKLDRAIEHAEGFGAIAMNRAVTELADSKALKTRITPVAIIVKQKGGPEADQPYASIVYDPFERVMSSFWSDSMYGIRNEADATVDLSTRANKQMQRAAKDGNVTAEELKSVLSLGTHVLEAAVTTPNMNTAKYTLNFYPEADGTDGAFIIINNEDGSLSLADDVTLRQARDFNTEIKTATQNLTDMYEPTPAS